MGKFKEKMQSRKFISWVVWSLITLTALVGSISSAWELPIDSIIGWYGGVTMMWIGVEGANDFVRNKLPK